MRLSEALLVGLVVCFLSGCGKAPAEQSSADPESPVAHHEATDGQFEAPNHSKHSQSAEQQHVKTQQQLHGHSGARSKDSHRPKHKSIASKHSQSAEQQHVKTQLLLHGHSGGRSKDSHRPKPEPVASNGRDPLAIFNRRILPIMQAKNPSSCSECHLSGVDLKDYIRADQAKTFAALRDRGLIDVEKPDQSKLLMFIRRKPAKPNLITDQVRQQEYEAFRAWILAAVNDPALLKTARTDDPLGAKLPAEVIRHARKDRVLRSFLENIWSEVGRCAACHSPDRNQKQVREHGEQVSWIQLGDPRGTLDYMIENGLIDTQSPADSLLLAKPTLQVEHQGGRKMVVGDRSYKQFRRFIEDYAAVVNGKYTSAKQLPAQSEEVSAASGIWFKLVNVPAKFDKKLLQVDLYRQDGGGWSKTRWATADRPVAGHRHLWQQQLSVTAPRNSKRANELRRAHRLPPGKYLAKIYIDRNAKLEKNYTTTLGDEDFVGEVAVDSRWTPGYGRMTVAKFPIR